RFTALRCTQRARSVFLSAAGARSTRPPEHSRRLASCDGFRHNRFIENETERAMGSGTRFKERGALVLSPGRLLLGALFLMAPPRTQAAWTPFAGNSQHTAVSAVAAQPLEVIRWSIPVDLAPGAILIHYGSPLVTPANTVVVPVKTGSTGGYRVEA